MQISSDVLQTVPIENVSRTFQAGRDERSRGGEVTIDDRLHFRSRNLGFLS